MATAEELSEALQDYITQANASARVRKTLKAWNCVIHLQATDIPAAFTLTIVKGESTGVREGLHDTPDLIVSGTGEDLANIFWGDANPASNYMQGAITVRGSQDDVMKLDAMSMFVYLKN